MGTSCRRSLVPIPRAWLRTGFCAILVRACIGTAYCAGSANALPYAEIKDGSYKARVYLPDGARGFYRGSRFDWSGMIPLWTDGNHNCFRLWKSADNPEVNHGAGPADEFGPHDANGGGPPCYSDSGPGGLFLKIGVGWLRKPSNEPYSSFKSYAIVDSGKWSVGKSAKSLSFVHRLPVKRGYGCLYRKDISLEHGGRTLVVSHTLKNIGSRPINTVNYCHNFISIDDTATGKPYQIGLEPGISPRGPLPGSLRKRGNVLRFVQKLDGEVHLDFDPGDLFGKARISVVNVETRTGIQAAARQPVESVRLFADKNVICPEFFFKISLLPGQSVTWAWEFKRVAPREDAGVME